MAKDPAFLFYSSDFLTGTMLFTDEQLGKYMRLLCLQHQQGHLTEKAMLSICKAYDQDVLSKFEKDDDGLYYNVRLEMEINKRKKYTESRRNNAQHPKNKTIKKRKAYAKHMENENEIENEDQSELKEGGVGEEKLLPKMMTVWKTENPSYKIIPDSDLKALRLIAQFITGKKGIEHIQNGQMAGFMDSWGKWCKHIRGSTLKNKSLDTIARFHLQEIDQNIKSPYASNSKNPQPGGKQAGAYELLERARQSHAARGAGNDQG